MTIAPVTCSHANYVPVEASRPRSLCDELDEFPDPAVIVAHLCTDCGQQLPAAWGCEDCEWYEYRAFQDQVPTRALAIPCPAHQEA